MRVLGLDLSLTSSGVALPDGTLTTIRTTRTDGDRRLAVIADTIGQSLHGVDLAVVEDLPTHAKGSGKTGQVHGAVKVELIRAGVPYLLVTAGSLKTYATGKGTADKADMRMALYQRMGIDERDDNQVDAWWLRALGHDLAGHPLFPLPKTHRRALDKLALPEGVA